MNARFQILKFVTFVNVKQGRYKKSVPGSDVIHSALKKAKAIFVTGREGS